MEDLPTPLSRIECYLAVAAGMDGVTLPEAPESRLEQFLAVIAGDTSVTLPTPLSLTELWLAYVAGEALTDEMELEGAYYIGPQKVDVRFFAVAGGMDGVVAPAPQNRTEQYWAKIAEIRPIHGVLKYATGTFINLTDVVSGLESLEIIYGDTTQQTYTGKNLLPMLNTTRTISDVTFTPQPDGSIKLSGTASAQINYPINNNSASIYRDVTLKTGTYTVYQATDSQTGVFVQAYYVDGGASKYSTGTFTVNDAEVLLAAYIRVNSGINTNGVTIYPMLVSGSTAGDYEPYVGGVPAPNPDYPQDVNVVTGEQNIKIVGKNLIPYPAMSGSTTISSVQFTQASDGKVTASGTTTGAVNWLFTNQFYVQQTGTYTLSFDGTLENATLYIYDLTASAVVAHVTNAQTQRSATITAGHKHQIYFNQGSSGKQISINGYAQLELGSPATPYKPYEGYNYNVDLTSKNILDFGSGTFGVSVVFTNGNATETHDTNSVVMEATGTVGAQYVRWITGELDSTKTYYLSFKAKKIVKGTAGEPIIQIIRYGSNDLSAWTNLGSTGTVVASPVEGTEYSLGATLSGYKYYRFYIYNNANTPVTVGEKTAYYDIQLELGSTATPYVPYREPIELCKIDTYQDYIYKSGSDWYVHKECNKYTFTGNESFTKSGYTTADAFVMWWATTALGIATAVDIGFCEFGMVRYLSNMGLADNGVIYNDHPNTCFVKMQKTMITNWDESATDAQKVTLAKAMIVGKSFYYPLATPTDTKITDATLIAELNAIDSATLPKPDANITLTATSPNLPASIKISYYGEEE